MLDEGLVDEVRSLIDAGFTPRLSSLSAIGYKQIASHLLGEIPLEEAIRQIRSKSRKFVRHQSNWFSEDDPEIKWFNLNGDTYKEILQEIQQFLS
jgi:tRNA dimethylallyltransferase